MALERQLHGPTGVKLFNNYLYITEYFGLKVRKIDLDTNIMTTLLYASSPIKNDGDGGDALSANVNYPRRIDFYKNGDMIILTSDLK